MLDSFVGIVLNLNVLALKRYGVGHIRLGGCSAPDNAT